MGTASTMSKLPDSSALTRFLTATASRNMTKAAHAAIALGIATMVLLTVNPAYEAAHRWIECVLWACLAFFAFEFLVRLRSAVRNGRALAYLTSGRGLLDLAGI